MNDRSNTPLAGVKVLDFAWALVGSVTTKTLADFGADVVKVESSTRPCLTRIDVQVSASQRGSFDDKPWFAHLNTSKRSLRLNMKHARAREVIGPLLEWADVVVENFSPGTMAKLGLDYATLSRRRPDLIMVSGSVYGQSGPLSQEWGVDGTGGAVSGRLLLTGWPDRPPVPPGAVPNGDLVLPYFMAAAVAAALQERRESGRGRYIDASMYEVQVQQMAEALAASQLGRPMARRGNRSADVLFQGVYPTKGQDRWIALSLFDAEDWRRFTAHVGGDWPDATALAAASETELDALDARVAQWTAEFEERALAGELQAMGLAAGMLQDAEDLVDRDPQLKHRGALVELDSAALGRFGHIATPVRLSRTPAALAPAPRLGEHDAAVAEIAGLDPETYAALAADGLFQ